jgi:methyltransferase (TIGR00027 family)
MFRSLKRVAYKVADIDAAKTWYTHILQRQPAFEAPFAVIFLVDNTELLLLPQTAGEKPARDATTVVYWAVDDVDAAYERMIGAGATGHTKAETIFGSRRALVVDPFGNTVGIMRPVAETGQRTVEQQPSETALGTAILRAVACNDNRQEVTARDGLARLFLTPDLQRLLTNPAMTERMVKDYFFPGAYEFIIARTAFFDDIVLNAFDEGVSQMVFLGAGYDTRPYRFRDKNKQTAIFEVDAPATQQRKRTVLTDAAVAIPASVKYIGVNFSTDDLRAALVAAGYDKDKKTLFAWEGVTYYLDPGAVDATLAFIRANSAPGSTVCFDYHAAWDGMETARGVKELLDFHRSKTAAEPFRFNIPKTSIRSFLADRGFTIVEHLAAEDIERRYLTLRDGSLMNSLPALLSFVQAATRRAE